MPFSRRRILQAGVALGATGVAGALSPELAQAANRALAPRSSLDLSDGAVIATFDAGSGPQQLGLRNLPGVIPGCSEALCARADGSIAVLDTLNRRIALVRGSSIAATIPLPSSVFPTDVRESGGVLQVLDMAGDQVLIVGGAGVTRVDIPRDRRSRISRLTPAGQPGAVGIVEEDVASSDYVVNPIGPQASASPGFGDGAGGRVVIGYPAALPARRRNVTVTTATGRFVVETKHPLGSVIALGTDTTGFLYLLVTELVPSEGGLDIDLTVRRYQPDGTFIAMARVPVRGGSAQPRTAVTIAANGDAYALVPDRRRTAILRLHWSHNLESLRPTRLPFPPGFGLANAALIIPNTRAQATAKAQTFYNYQWTATQAMLDRTCTASAPPYPVSQRPSYLTVPGTYFEIPYCFGAFDEPGAFVLRINSPYNYTTGDKECSNPPGWKGCTAGVDCSGFIQQCWGIGPPKQDDTTLLNWVTNSPGQPLNVGGTLYPGDLWRLPGQHVRLHYSYPGDGTGDYMYEASLQWGERVWYAFHGWADYANYLWCLGNFAS